MTYTCRICKQAFTSKLQYELHRDTCSSEALICECCGEQFSEQRATCDGWHYDCPNDGCDGSGLGEDLHNVRNFSVVTQTQ